MPSVTTTVPSRPTPATDAGTNTVTTDAVARPDPLAVTIARGTDFRPVDQFSLRDEIAAALETGADVPGRVQDGPTCGLYALGMVMDYWDRQDPANLNPLVQDSDVVRWNSHTAPADTEHRLLEVAQKRGFTTQGEMFYADQVGALAKEFGYDAKVTENVTLEDIKACVDRDHPALVPFDVDNKGDPGLFGGKRAHWAVIESHFKEDDQEYLVATHGWTGKTYVWRAENFMASVNQLNASDFPAAPRDITTTLRGRMVEVFPPQPSAL